MSSRRVRRRAPYSRVVSEDRRHESARTPTGAWPHGRNPEALEGLSPPPAQQPEALLWTREPEVVYCGEQLVEWPARRGAGDHACGVR